MIPQVAENSPSVPFRWVVRNGRALTTSAPFGVVGIVNLTPDSFFDGGRHYGPCGGLAHAMQLYADGADLLDLGAESSRPGAVPVSPDDEQARLLPVLAALRTAAPAAVLSVDTCRASTAAAALAMGAAVINDVSACIQDPALLDVIIQYRPGYVLTHNGGFPADRRQRPFRNGRDGICREVMLFFEQGLHRLTSAGLPEERIILDPGIGFGKTLKENMLLLTRVEEWLSLGRPIMLGLSMKSLFGSLLGLPVHERGPATLAATVCLWQKGIFWHRVHDVPGVRQALATAAALCLCPVDEVSAMGNGEQCGRGVMPSYRKI
ncbi:MAG: dihydropteroate synthase [Desulfovibrio sp.]|nr:dihydropteroate synthase [Desulfovibrio sp.]